MQVLQPTFTLLPNFSYLPDRDIRLGTVLSSSNHGRSKQPDPRRPLNKNTRVKVDPSDIDEQTYTPWNWSSEQESSSKLGLHADLSIFTGIGGGFSGHGSKASGLVIQCDSVHASKFMPDGKYLAATVKDETIATLGRKLRAPPLYMIVGLMVATGAQVRVTRKRGAGGSADLSADATSVGVPINIGPEAEHHHSAASEQDGTPTRPFILAYELIQLKIKRDGSVKERDFTEAALFQSVEYESEEAAAFAREWEVEDVVPEQLDGEGPASFRQRLMALIPGSGRRGARS